MGRIFVVELEGRSYRCKFCKTHLALAHDLVSRTKRWRSSFGDLRKYHAYCIYKCRSGSNERVSFLVTNYWGFHCRRGKAYLFNNVVNISFGAFEERMMLSGLHTVAETFCCYCGQIVGWKYEVAHEDSQKYKEGKFVLERGRIVDEIDFSTEFYIDTHASTSDAEDA